MAGLVFAPMSHLMVEGASSYFWKGKQPEVGVRDGLDGKPPFLEISEVGRD